MLAPSASTSSLVRRSPSTKSHKRRSRSHVAMRTSSTSSSHYQTASIPRLVVRARSSLVARSSVSRLRARCCGIRRCCCLTRRRLRSTRTRRRLCRKHSTLLPRAGQRSRLRIGYRPSRMRTACEYSSTSGFQVTSADRAAIDISSRMAQSAKLALTTSSSRCVGATTNMSRCKHLARSDRIR